MFGGHACAFGSIGDVSSTGSSELDETILFDLFVKEYQLFNTVLESNNALLPGQRPWSNAVKTMRAVRALPEIDWKVEMLRRYKRARNAVRRVGESLIDTTYKYIHTQKIQVPITAPSHHFITLFIGKNQLSALALAASFASLYLHPLSTTNSFRSQNGTSKHFRSKLFRRSRDSCLSLLFFLRFFRFHLVPVPRKVHIASPSRQRFQRRTDFQ